MVLTQRGSGGRRRVQVLRLAVALVIGQQLHALALAFFGLAAGSIASRTIAVMALMARASPLPARLEM
ncbi:hypothetical protein [Variovorax brevis]|uniref:hypothetical protein n=1 Tax=Variovorax brevis TaxID=3053503 RepID=UPI002575713B|nr:hypothetical protein [Variovorax sp. J22R133]